MLKRLILLLILLVPCVYAEEINSYYSINVNISIDSKIFIKPEKSDYVLESVNANLSFVPIEDDYQKVSGRKTKAEPEDYIYIGDDYVLYEWRKPDKKELDYSYFALVNSRYKFKEINNKIKFPFSSEGFVSYLVSDDKIKSDDIEVRKKATEILSGEDDLYEAVFKVGDWIRNDINYSLDTMTEELTQDARWVLDNKRGVCDEITVLFISMLRSVKIPTKFVSGVAYSNVIEGFGPHAWAEVYFPGQGWIPFDVTFGQLGYVDSSHIKMEESSTTDKSSVSYSWKSKDVKLEFSELSVKAEFVDGKEIVNSNINLNSKLLKNNVGAGSYVPLQVNIENKNSYYLPLALYIVKAPGVYGDNKKSVLLKPNEKKVVFFILKIPDELEEGYTYSSVIEVSDLRKNNDITNLEYSKYYQKINLENTENMINELSKETEEKFYKSDVELECQLDKDYYLDYENAKVNCWIRNKGNYNLNNINVCLESCRVIDLIINEEKVVEFNLDLDNLTSKDLKIRVENSEILAYEFLDLRVFKEPGLKVSSLGYPKIVDYDEYYNITFNLESDTMARDIRLYLNKKKIYDTDYFEGKSKVVLPFKGNVFYDGEGALKLFYKDKNNKEYGKQYKVEINVENSPWYAGIVKFFNNIF